MLIVLFFRISGLCNMSLSKNTSIIADSETEGLESEGEIQHRAAQNEKNKRKKKYRHKYQSSWEKDERFKRWVKPSRLGELFFFCDICSKDYTCGTSELLKHQKSKKHIEKAAVVKTRQTLLQMKSLTTKSTETKVKTNEIKIASYVAEHNLPINNVDHLVGLIKSLHLDEDVIKKMSCNRTKCTAIITNVTGAYGQEEVINIIKEEKFSLIIDESTDRSSVKHLALVVRYMFKNRICDSFLTLIPVAEANAQNMYNLIVDFFHSHNIPYKNNLIAFAADGASTMMGKNHSVSVLLKNDVPHMFILKCICHSVALCASQACKKLPDRLEVLVKNLYSHMNHSFKRLNEFKDFQLFTETKIHKLLYAFDVRWLSLQLAVDRVLEQWNALLLYFRSQHLEKKDRTVEALHAELENKTNKIYLTFLSFVLPIFNKLNKEFQSESPKITNVYNHVCHTLKTILDFYIEPTYLSNNPLSSIQFRNPAKFCKIEDVYFGPKVIILLDDPTLSQAEKNDIRVNCLNFYIEAAYQFYLRFPLKDMDALKDLCYIDPTFICEKKPSSIVPVVQHFPHLVSDLNLLDLQYRMLRNDEILINYPKEDVFKFYVHLKNAKNEDGSLKYDMLIKFAFCLMILPHSSACVERLFSQINLNKTKIRNRLSTEVLCGILHTKHFIGDQNCFDVKIESELIKKVNLKMYDKDNLPK